MNHIATDLRQKGVGAGRLALASVMLALAVNSASAQEIQLGIPDADYSLEKLIEAAKLEQPITVVDATGKIKVMAENFTAKYGVQATGVKLSGQAQEEVITREAAAKNVQSDVFNMSNLPSVAAHILPQGIGVSWMPPDLKQDIPEYYQSPAITSVNPWVWAYNTEVYGDKCPIDNVWALTDEKWKGKISIPDPLLRNETMFWFNQMEENGDDQMRAAYEAYFGKPLVTEEKSATAEWVKRLAANRPKVEKSDTDVGPIVGAKGQADPFLGFMSAAIFRDAAKNDYSLGICGGLKPWVGQLTPRVAVIAAGTNSPNAAKLFVHFMMTEEGIAPQLIDGKISSNRAAKMPANEASGIIHYLDQLYVNNSATLDNDYARLQDWQDFWLVNLK